MEISDAYDLFNANANANANTTSPTYPTGRFRSNTSPAAPSYSLNTDSLYSHPFHGDSLPSFHSQNTPGPYDIVSSISSSYSSGKATPLTPNDPIHHSPFAANPPPPKHDLASPPFSDLISDRRLSSVSSNGFQPDIHDDFGLSYASNSLPPFQERLSRYSNDNVYHSLPPVQHNAVAPQATHYRPDAPPSYDDYMLPNPTNTLSLLHHIQPQGPMGAAADLQSFIRPFLDQYVRTPNRLAFGERTVIVMSSKVAQKSYGQEKRFLCPPPTAIMIGNSWWSDVVRRGEEPRLSPPRVVVSISGEPAPQEGTVEWCAAAGKPFDATDPPTGTTYIGRCVGKQLFISDVDEKKKKVEALVKIVAPAGDDEPERVIGTFPSRPIKVISKPSKKRQSAKNLELCINHGSTISLFHRLHPFVMYIVDVDKPAGGIDAPPPPPPQPEYPSPPPNAIPFMNNGSPIPIYYNQTVVLQCLTSGVVSPVLIIRKVDHQTTVVGGGAQEGAKGVGESYCVPGEVCGDPVSQLHKVAFEVYEPGKGAPEPGTPGASGAFLSCMGEKVNTYRPIDGRMWAGGGLDGPLARGGGGGGGGESPGLPGSPLVGTPASAGGANGDYFGHGGHPHGPLGGSEPTSPGAAEFPSNDGGRVKKGKRSASSAGGVSRSSASSKGRRRPTSAGSSGSRHAGGDGGASSGALWQVDIGETSVWTIVGTDQVRYNFYVPPVLFDHPSAPQTGSFPIPSKPVTPFPGVVKYLPPDRAAEAPKGHGTRQMLATKNAAPTSKMLTLYGENFVKTEPVSVFFGSEPSPFVEVRCTEVVGCLPPEGQGMGMGMGAGKRRPIILVRGDGVVFPSATMYP
ncbi:hypothetical protein OF83DRAFT_1166655 [Amylostereum chailletii]|nr:hypothetical protein OF83DRAFT_1166655 [Amylostereum chailletii]